MAHTILIICGPTAVGKTNYSIELAKRLSGEIVSCDSMQLYKYMDIGSAKPSEEELIRVKHHLVDCIDPLQDFSAAKYKIMSENAIDDILSRGKLPIVTGGTGLYLNSILYNMDFSAPPCSDDTLRNELYREAEEKGVYFLHNKLKNLDESSAERIHPNNVKRVVRAIEAAQSGQSIRDISRDVTPNEKYSPIMICLNRNREELYDRINKRVDVLMEKGLVGEVEMLLSRGLTKDNISMKGIGYKEIISFIEGEVSLSDAIDLIKRNTRHYAKRQLTWFRRYKNMKWYNISEYSDDNTCLEDMINWLTNLPEFTTKATNRIIL